MKRPRKKLISRSFKRGAGLIPISRYAEFRQELMAEWGIIGITTWYQRLRGERALTPCEIEAAERIFAKYGVTKDKVWGKEDGLERTPVED